MRTCTLAVCAIGLAAAALAQEKELLIKHKIDRAEAGTIQFMSMELGPAKVVKGAPYSAETVTEFRQVLADGNVIERKQTGAAYRDSEGRTRTEAPLLGHLTGSAGEREIITIVDPVAGVRYTVNSAEKSAMKIVTAETGAPYSNIALRRPAPAGPAPGGGLPVRHRAGAENVKEESLGARSFDGVQAEGSRRTITIPAGEMGNVRPIIVTDERWYSPQLQTVVMTRHSDPRTGEQTFHLRNIRLGEPARNLFEPPPGYEVHEMKDGRIHPEPRQ